MTELLRLAPDHRVLEIGTGSGYQAAVLAELAGEVWTIERHADLAQQAEELLAGLGYTNVHGDRRRRYPRPPRGRPLRRDHRDGGCAPCT